ncbi:MAG TPA: OmpH family outer membrane protein [Fulvivirga sp.]|nr:OmpH family outer membrane protein [Fulvivirga sp.]
MRYLPHYTALLALAVSAFTLYFSIENKPKIAYIESNRLLVSYKGMQAASSEYQNKVKIWTANIDTLRNELQTEIKKYEVEKKGLSKKERQLTEKLINTKQKQLVDYQRSIEQKAAKEDQEVTQKVLDKVSAYVKSFGNKHGYTIIIGATESGNLVYAEEALNLTDEILIGLNEEYEKN